MNLLRATPQTRTWPTKFGAIILGLTFSCTALAFGGGGGGNNDDPASEYAQGGGIATTVEAGGSNCTIYRPRSLTGGHPVIIWGNGTGNSPSSTGAGLSHLASWGFVVAAANTSNAGTGSAMIGCLNWLENSNLRNALDFTRVGSTGYSQGGGGAIMAGRDARIDATAPMSPYTVGLGHNSSSQSQQRGPMLLLSGSSDFIAAPRTNQQPVFDRANVPVFWATLNGAGHSEPRNDFGRYRGITTAWFLYQLKGDNSVASLFEGRNCGFCSAAGWDIRRKGF